MIAIVKYNAGNIRSVQNAVERLGYEVKITDDPIELMKAEKVIFPGVGEAASAMNYLRSKGLDDTIKNLKQPVLGICLGLQLLCSSSEEGETTCLGIFPNRVRKFRGTELIPHMGWNEIAALNGELFTSVSENENVYFVHSYYAELSDYSIALCDYIKPFSAAIKKDNFYATQFHPEKSAGIGAQILKNFLEL